MKIATSPASAIAALEHVSAPVVLVPTMGALHQGHLALVELAREQATHRGFVVVSIFVNPLQFEPGSDYAKYPRPLQQDEQLCRDVGVDLVFRPMVDGMYHDDRSVTVEENALSAVLCGKSRPGHFRGVCTVVTKLFHIVRPNVAIFGEKDFQQLAIIRRMVRDLNFPVEIIGAPTIREPDGLALSSRNQYLTGEEREQASVISAALRGAVESARGGEASAAHLVEHARSVIASAPLANIDYIEVVDGENLQSVDRIVPNARIAAAVFFGKTRLIDNMALA